MIKHSFITTAQALQMQYLTMREMGRFTLNTANTHAASALSALKLLHSTVLTNTVIIEKYYSPGELGFF